MKNNATIKTLIVSPYFSSLGGGELYMLSIADALGQQGHQIHIGWDSKEDIDRLIVGHGLALKDYSLASDWRDLYFSGNPLSTLRASRDFDNVFYLSDGSLPFLGGHRNFIHFQVPLQNISGRIWKNKLKLLNINRVIVNSRFTKRVIDREFGVKSIVIYPPVTFIGESKKKENIILSVGRFEGSLNVKKQDVLIEAFLSSTELQKKYKLVLAGSAVEGDAFVSQLIKLAKSKNIQILTNLTRDQLVSLYAKAKIYWHAAGYGVDENNDPALVEHFGISTVEAISAGCIPMVVAKGGQAEIVPNPEFHWLTIEELVEKTIKNSSVKFETEIERYGKDRFIKQITELTHDR